MEAGKCNKKQFPYKTFVMTKQNICDQNALFVNVTSNLVTIVKSWQQTQLFMKRKQIGYVYPHHGILLNNVKVSVQ